jgi:hypothetical protein
VAAAMNAEPGSLEDSISLVYFSLTDAAERQTAKSNFAGRVLGVTRFSPQAATE